MFLVEFVSKDFLVSLGFISESGALLLCGISLIGGTLAARKFFKYKDDEEIIKRAKEINPETEK
jgi:hypothetical protein